MKRSSALSLAAQVGSKSSAAAASAAPAVAPAPVSAYTKMMSSPLRRCVLTNKVLPNELLIQLKLARLPDFKRLVFTPTLQHPRFAPSYNGRSTWVSCWSRAVRELALRGSYKRNTPPGAVWPKSMEDMVCAQLGSRVVQEMELFFERTRARSAWVGREGGRLREAPVRRITREEWDAIRDEGHLEALREEGRKVVAVVVLGDSAEEGLSWLMRVRRSATVEEGPTEALAPQLAPVYNLAAFLKQANTTPSSNSTSPLDGALADEVKGWLDKTVDLFARRRQKVSAELETGPPPTSAAEGVLSDDVFVLYTSEEDGSSVEDLVPLLIALWRCRLWVGEGWEGEPVLGGRKP